MFSCLSIPKKYVVIIFGLFAIGFISRVLPLFDIDGRLLQQFPTEDGYLMLTIARNIALGLGMSTADGTIATNGTQPFSTFLWAAGFYFTDGDKVGGVIFTHILQLLASMASAFMIYKLIQKVFLSYSYNKDVAFIASALFFSSSHILPHTINFLETGNYLLVIIITIFLFYETDEEAAHVWSIKKSILIGCFLGLVFWVRIDAAFLILAACLSYIFRGLPYGFALMLKRFYRSVIFGAVSVVIALPWLINNYVRFGSLTPISGHAQAANKFAENILIVPSILIEYLFVIIPIPHDIQTKPVIVLLSTIILAVFFLITYITYSKSSHKHRSLMLMGIIFTLCIVSYYGLFFGAQHFTARYFAATSPFLLLLTTSFLVFIFQQVKKPVYALLFSTSILVLLLVAGLNVRIFMNGVPHQHSQVINWVAENVPEKSWVGAVQTGTLGYFHDRTINLDGKVNPEALAARQGASHCPDSNFSTSEKSKGNCIVHYIIDQNIEYLVDWVGLAKWINIPPMSDYFTLIVDDSEINLAVLKRNGISEN